MELEADQRERQDMKSYTINAISKGEYESVEDVDGSWVSRTAADALAQQLAEASKERDVYQEYIHACQIDCDDEYIDTTHEVAVELYRKNSKLPPVPFGRVAALQVELAQACKERDELKHDIEKSMTVSNIYLNEIDALKKELADERHDKWILQQNKKTNLESLKRVESYLAAARAEVADWQRMRNESINLAHKLSESLSETQAELAEAKEQHKLEIAIEVDRTNYLQAELTACQAALEIARRYIPDDDHTARDDLEVVCAALAKDSK